MGSVYPCNAVTDIIKNSFYSDKYGCLFFARLSTWSALPTYYYLLRISKSVNSSKGFERIWKSLNGFERVWNCFKSVGLNRYELVSIVGVIHLWKGHTYVLFGIITVILQGFMVHCWCITVHYGSIIVPLYTWGHVILKRWHT